MSYSMDMKEEKNPQTRMLLPQGWRSFQIMTCEEQTSKQGNKMFVFECEDLETNYIDKWYAIAEQGKRWFLKSILTACDVEAGQDGVYKWDIKDVLSKVVEGLVVHEDNEWINREGEKVVSKQHKVIDIRKSSISKNTEKVTEEERQQLIDENKLGRDE